MPRAQAFSLVFAPEAVGHLRIIERKYHRLIRKQIRLHLKDQPDKPTRNRKPLEVPAPSGAQWELRLGPRNRFRVFYEVSQEARTVKIVAIGVKEGNVLRAGTEEYAP